MLGVSIAANIASPKLVVFGFNIDFTNFLLSRFAESAGSVEGNRNWAKTGMSSF
jgi:hypothetical protein